MRPTTKSIKEHGFTLTETLVTVVIVGLLTAIALPNHINQLCRSNSAEAEATIGSLQSIISSFADETGILPKSWDELNSISAVMTNEGQANGDFENKIILPSESYELAITGPSEAQYLIEARPIEGCEKRDIKACVDLSTGASALTLGDGQMNATLPNCA